MNIPRSCLIAIVAFVVVLSAQAQETLEAELFLQAKKAFAKGDQAQYLMLKEQLHDHPLYPYLEYYELKRHFKTVDDSLIEKYIETHPDSPMAEKLRIKLQDELIDEKQWDAFLALYEPSSKVSQQCDYLMATYQAGKKASVESAIKTLWLNAKNQPENCMSVFDLWLGNSADKDRLVWQRFELALLDKNIELAKQLVSKLSPAKKKEASLILRVYKNPSLVKKASFIKTKPSAEVLSYGIYRLARISPGDAINIWKHLRKTTPFNEAQEQRIFQSVGLTMAMRKNKNATKWFRHVIGAKLAPIYKNWMIRAGIINQDWQFVVDSIEGLPADEKALPRWQYWYGRALGELGKKEQSKSVLANVSTERDYYGFMADYYLHQPIDVKHKVLTVTDEEIAKVESTPGFVRAKLLYQLKQMHDARVELFTLMHHLSEKEQYIVSKLINEWGWYPQSLRLSHYADHKDDLMVRFPLPYRSIIAQYSKENHVDPALIYAIMRQESYFMPSAQSHAGARGLMQLMPDTARRTAKKYKLPYGGETDLSNENKNIQLGSAHIRKLKAEFSKHPALVIAAYNAGKNAVRRWVPKHKTLPTDVWIESVTYRETRRYLRHVIACYVVYQHRLGLEPSLSRIMKRVGT